jgi:hypothetical protein
MQDLASAHVARSIAPGPCPPACRMLLDPVALETNMSTHTLPQDDGEQMDLRRKFDHLGIDCSEGLEKAERTFREKYRYPSGDLWKKLDELAGSSFSEVFQFELDALTTQVPTAPRQANLAQVLRRAHETKLAGLAFSGGGIRSATFNLGIVQALAEMKLLRDFDYLSTVSGGGYIGGWLSKWISQEGGDVTRVEQAFESTPPRTSSAATPPQQSHSEPRAVQFLRRYSNYLTPKTGMFSADTWTLICTYLRNTLLNMTILLTLLAALFLLPRLVMEGIMPAFSADARQLWPLAALLFLWPVALIAFSISRTSGRRWSKGLVQTQGAVLRWICVPLVLSGIVGSIGVWQIREPLDTFWKNLPDSLFDLAYGWFLAPGVAYFAAWVLGWVCAQYLNRRDAARGGPGAEVAAPVSWRAVGLEGLAHLVCAATALAVGSVLLLKGVSLIVNAPATTLKGLNGVGLATFGMPAMLSLFGITITLMIGLVGRLYRDESREWWARQGAWTFILALSWLGLFAAAFYLPPLLAWAWETYGTTTTVGGLVASLLTLLGLKAGSGKSTGPNMTNVSKTKELAALVAPYAFSVLVIALLAAALQRTVAPVTTVPQPKQLWSSLERYTGSSSAAAAPKAEAMWQCTGKALKAQSAGELRSVTDECAMSLDLKLFLTCIAIGLVLAWRVDINKFSLYMMYRLRLVRAYLGATTPHRAPHPFTGFDPQDDSPLSSLLKHRQHAGGTAPLQRPYHLLNAAVNLVGGKELAWQTRKAANFVFSPGFCGFELPRMPDDRARRQLRGAFRPTAQYASEESALRDNDAVIKLGTAVAVSGAAASPNMGYHTSAPLSFLMTLFNLRLGRWSPNPMHEKVWRQPAPRIGLASIFSELLGLTDAEARFLYLSDGGHFENLGVYELVRRRCRLIVVVDSSADRPQAFADLGNAVRKCLTDFNIPIELNVRQIRPFGADTLAGVSFVTGKVRYSQVDGNDAHNKPYPDGILLYIKPTIVGSENAGVLNYSRVHPEFPHESTADQWFDESQFESYRILGYEAGRAALASIATELPETLPVGDKARIEAICSLLAKPSMASVPAEPRNGAARGAGSRNGPTPRSTHYIGAVANASAWRVGRAFARSQNGGQSPNGKQRLRESLSRRSSRSTTMG